MCFPTSVNCPCLHPTSSQSCLSPSKKKKKKSIAPFIWLALTWYCSGNNLDTLFGNLELENTQTCMISQISGVMFMSDFSSFLLSPVSLSSHLNPALSTGLICLGDQWKGLFFPHSDCDTRNTELMKEWWYLITFQRIAPASELLPKLLLKSYKQILCRSASSLLFSSSHSYIFNITCCKGSKNILCGEADPAVLGVSTRDFSIRPWQWDYYV